MLRLLAGDRVLWAAGALIALLVAGAAMLKPSAPTVLEGGGPLAGRQAQAAPGQDPALAAVVNGTFPAVDAKVTLGQAFAAYRWFSGEPKWLARGAGSRLVGVTAVLEVPAAAARLGVGSNAAAVLYVAEFEVSPDGVSFKPVLSAVEVRDATNRLLARVPDTDFVQLRRVMRGAEPTLNLPGQPRKAQ
ncbi:hypothetical protein [Fundidesulfovibrio soli]|uniref:hypothetical protein n=1 Tax=Fundidesulfovibrio soli TaxID=2922716 RepID=UPI001FAF9B0B|nr:hypothetical protein [Fundidesulfovibrio soli]